ncbi:hypothetical protein Tco_0304272 [Tanacetum coccineum]
MAEGLSGRMLMEHRDAQGQSVFTSRAWRRLLDIRGPLVHELILGFFSIFKFGEAVLDLDTAGALQFKLGEARCRLSWRQFILALGLHTAEEMETIGISSAGDFLSTNPSYTSIRDPILRLCHRLIACNIARRSQAPEKVIATDLFYPRGLDVGSVNIPYLLARYLRRFAAGRKSGALISGVTEEASVAPGSGDEDEEMPQAVPPPPRTQGERIARLEEEVIWVFEDFVILICDFSHITASDVREDDEEFEAEASAAEMKEIAVDPLAISDSSKSFRGGIPDLEDTIYDIVHYMSEVRIDRITEIETTQRQLETSQLVASGESASLVERIRSLRLEYLKVRRDHDDTWRRLRRLESYVERHLGFRP